MGIIENLFGLVFGDASRRTIEVFRENAEKSAERQHERHAAALGQFSAEFIHARPDRFGSFIDGLNRLPRPLIAFGVLALFCSAMADPIWFATRMQGLALVPEPLWWLLGAVISLLLWCTPSGERTGISEKLAGQYGPNAVGVRKYKYVGRSAPSKCEYAKRRLRGQSRFIIRHRTKCGH